MLTKLMSCDVCGTSSTPFFIFVGDAAVCINCKKSKNKNVKEKVENAKQRPPIFIRYICRTHKCSTYNLNQWRRHVTPDCEIDEEQTLGVVKPKTVGGFNGDINKRYYLKPKVYQHLLDNLGTYREIQRIKYKLSLGRELYYYEEKFYRKHIHKFEVKKK